MDGEKHADERLLVGMQEIRDAVSGKFICYAENKERHVSAGVIWIYMGGIKTKISTVTGKPVTAIDISRASSPPSDSPFADYLKNRGAEPIG